MKQNGQRDEGEKKYVVKALVFEYGTGTISYFF